MSTDLSSALQAISSKIAASASGATPEELAYLGTAIDRIGGRATIYEVAQIGDLKKAELEALAKELMTTLQAAIGVDLTAFHSDVNTTLGNATQTIADAQNTATAHATLELSTFTSAVNTSKAAATSAINAAANTATMNVQTAVDALSSASALATQQAVSGSMLLNYYFSMV
jgi:hypothetical protein